MISQAETAGSQQQQKQQPSPSSPPIKSPTAILLKHESLPLTRQQSLSPEPNTKTKHIHSDTSHHHHHNHHHHHPSKQQTTNTTTTASTETTTTTSTTPTSPLHNTNNSNNSIRKSPSIKKRKRFEETIIDGFSIIAFKTWEDLQDELNERSSLLSTATAAAADSASGNSYDHNVVKKAGSKSRHKSNNSSLSLDANVTNSNGTSTTTTSVATTTSGHHHHHHHHKDGSKKKKKDKVRKSPSRSPDDDEQPREKRNKTSSDKTTLKKALEAKELAEKRLSILQKKLEQEQNKNRSGSNVDPLSDQDQNQNRSTTSNVPDHHSLNASHHHNSQEQQIRKDDLLTNVSYNSNSIGHDQIKQEQLNYLNAPKPAPYSPFHINSHLQRTKTIIHQQHQPMHTPPPAPHPSMHSHLGQTSHLSPQKQPHMPTPNLQPPNLHHRVTPPLQPEMRDSYYSKQRISTPPTSTQSTNYQQHRSPMHSQSQTAPHYMIPPHQQQHGPPLHSPYNPASLMSSMGLNPLASPYSCPQICITDTISRQTSIIPPLGATLEQSTSQTSTRYGHHPSMLAAHSAAHLNPHHQMLYPMTPTPTERSFMEFVRSYPTPSHMGYPSLNSLIPPPPSAGSATHTPAPPAPLHSLPHHPSGSLAVPPNFGASAYGSDRSAWPRPLGVDRAAAAAAASRYNSLYPNPFCPIPERPSYASYAGARPPPFHASLFQPPF